MKRKLIISFLLILLLSFYISIELYNNPQFRKHKKLLTSILSNYCPLPSDGELIFRFANNAKDYESLRSMIISDKLHSVGVDEIGQFRDIGLDGNTWYTEATGPYTYDEVLAKTGVNRDRATLYRTLLTSTGTQKLINRGDQITEFIMADTINGTKKIVYSKMGNPSGYSAVTKIKTEKSWYIVYQSAEMNE